MRIVIEPSDFRVLSPATRRELLDKFSGKALEAAAPRRGAMKLSWRQPVDLNEAMAARLLHGLSEPHRRRLELFARQGGRVRQTELLAVNGDSDLRALSHFQAVLSRRLRRFLDDPKKQVHLIGWDFGSEEWDRSHTQLLDGIYYVTEKTTRALQTQFGGPAEQPAAGGRPALDA